jgi:trk system potassium uptake protein TrkA
MYVIIAGAGIIGQEIIKMLVEKKHDVVAVDKDPEVCETVYTETGALTINGDATDIHILERAGAAKADVLVCLMHSPADNIACTLMAKSLGVPRVLARLRNQPYEEAYKLAGVTSIIKMADLLVNELMMEIEQPKIRKVVTLGGGRADIYAVKIPQGAKTVGMSVKDIAKSGNFPEQCLFVGTYDEDKETFQIPRGSNILQEGDIVFLVSNSQHIKQAADFLTKIK